MVMSTSDKYEHFSKGDTVAIGRRTRICRDWSAEHGCFLDVTEVPAGATGTVVDMTNAGFRGLEYGIETDYGRVHGVSAADLALLEAVEVRPWPRQRTYRNGTPIQEGARR